MMIKEGSTKIVTFMTPLAGVLMLGCGVISHIVKMHYFFKKISSLLPCMDKKNKIYSNDDQGRVFQNCKFHDPGGRGSCVRVWSYKSYSKKNALILLKSSSLLPGIDQTN